MEWCPSRAGKTSPAAPRALEGDARIDEVSVHSEFFIVHPILSVFLSEQEGEQ